MNQERRTQEPRTNVVMLVFSLPPPLRLPRRGSRSDPSDFTRGAPQPHSRRLGRTDDRRQLRRPDRIHAARGNHRRRAAGVEAGAGPNAIEQDDLYVDMTFAKVLDDKGLDATTRRFRRHVQGRQVPALARQPGARGALLKRGVPATLSGTPKYNAHANDIDFQIEADFIGLMAPGLPQAANDLRHARRPRHELRRRHLRRHVRFRMYAAAFFEKRPAQGGGGRPGRASRRRAPTRG